MESTTFSPYQLLTELSSSQSSGVLKASNGGVTWHIYLSAGELQYVDYSVQTLAQMSYFLCRQGLRKSLYRLKENASHHHPMLGWITLTQLWRIPLVRTALALLNKANF